MKLFVSLLLPLVSAATFQQHVQVPLVNTEKTTTGAAPGIGIHFTTSYAIAVVRYANGTFQQLPRINGNSEYINSMVWWADPESPVFVDPNQNIRAREALASMLSRVRSAIEQELDEPVNNVYAVFPVSQGLRREDVEDAFQRSNLNWLVSEDLPFLETNAAYAGLGHGLCPSFPDMDRCQQEAEATQFEHVLFLNFDNSSFGAAYHPMHAAAAKSPSPNSYILDTYLGWWNLPVEGAPRSRFLADINDVIKDVVRPININPSKIIVLGDHAAEESLHEAAKSALWETLDFDASRLLEEGARADGLSLAAKGAAEWAFRIQYMSSYQGVGSGLKNGEKERIEL